MTLDVGDLPTVLAVDIRNLQTALKKHAGDFNLQNLNNTS